MKYLLIETMLCPRSYIGHVKERTVKEQMVRDSTEVLRKAVHRMLPRNKLRDVSAFFELSCLVRLMMCGYRHLAKTFTPLANKIICMDR